MNRNKPVEDLQQEQFISLTEKMESQDKLSLYQALVDSDFSKADEILKKYGHVFVKPAENRISDEDAEKLAASMAKNGTAVVEEMDAMMYEMTRKYWSERGRLSDIPLDDYESIVKEVRFLDKSFYEKEDLNKLINTIHGENAVLIMKVAGIMDIVGCQSLRNDLYALFHKMVNDAEYARTMDIYRQKKIISEDRSKSKKGKTNRHREEVLRVAKLTWDAYPNAGCAGMAESISSHLNSKWNDVPAVSTLQTWLKDSGLAPDVPAKDRNRKFKLIVE